MTEQIKELCKLNGISVRKLERDIGIANGLVGKMDNYSPTISTVMKIADYFGCGVDELIGYKKPKYPKLMAIVNQLNEPGIEMLTIMARGLVITDEYKKSNKSNNVQKDA